MEQVPKLIRTALFTPWGHGNLGMPIILWGDPGVGKTDIIEGISRSYGSTLPVVPLVASQMDPCDFGGTSVPVDGRLEKMFGPEFMELVDKGRGFFFLDEISNAPRAVQAALLRFIQSRRLGSFRLPPEVRIIAAANPVSQAADGCDLSLPTANRFIHLGPYGANADSWLEWLISNGGEAEDDEDTLDAVSEEKRVAHAWPMAYAKARGALAGYIKSRPMMLLKTPTDGLGGLDTQQGWRAYQTYAYPSPRSNEFAARCLAAGDVHGLSEVLTDELVAGAIGPSAAGEFATWRNEADLPDPKALLDGTVKWKPERRRPDKVAAVLTACAAIVAMKQTEAEKRKSRGKSFWKIVDHVIDEGLPDIAWPAAKVAYQSGLGSTAVSEATNPLSRLSGLKEAAEKMGLR